MCGILRWSKKGPSDYESSRREMVERLKGWGYLQSERVAKAMEEVPRHLFVPEDQQPHAYEDRPLPVGEGQTISAPHMVAIMCEALELNEGDKVLEVGAGTGYHACVIAHILENGFVYTIERIEELVENARANLEKAACTRVEVILGDGTEGYGKEAPYDRILVTAGAPEIPKPLTDQLKPGGMLLIPVGGRYLQELISVIKNPDGGIEKRDLGGCAFVPLIGRYGWEG
ncbi:MAG: protein-L-isoaspartate O-methyltransferase [Candidatus Hydrothermarchaeales archaeon]